MLRLLIITIALSVPLSAWSQTPQDDSSGAQESGEEQAAESDADTEQQPAEEAEGAERPAEEAEGAEQESTEEAEGAEQESTESDADEAGASKPVGVQLADLETIEGSGFDANAKVELQFQENSTDSMDASYRYKWRKVSPSTIQSTDFKVSFNATGSSRTNSNGDEIIDYSQTLTLDGTAGPSSNHASFSYDSYISPKFGQPTFLFVEPQVRIVSDASESDGEQTDGPDQMSAAATVGFGFGRVYPSASYERASAIIKILRREGLLLRTETPGEVQDLIGILKRRWDPTKDVLKALDYMKSKGLVAAGETPSSLIAEMVMLVEQSFDYKETGSQYRLGVNYNFMTGETESDVQPLLLAASYTEVFGDERLIIQPFAYFYKRIDEDEDASYGATIDIRYAKSARSELFFTDRWSPDVQNSIEAGWRYTLSSFMNAEVKYTLDIPLSDPAEDPDTGETEEQEWPAAIIVSLKAGGRGL
ncbi:MAG: hypothetical protein CL940_03830 [Deltaproteobacteria bacterium]|nr:hypothetical protein [Deltaproteobacteria bacterium]